MPTDITVNYFVSKRSDNHYKRGRENEMDPEISHDKLLEKLVGSPHRPTTHKVTTEASHASELLDTVPPVSDVQVHDSRKAFGHALPVEEGTQSIDSSTAASANNDALYNSIQCGEHSNSNKCRKSSVVSKASRSMQSIMALNSALLLLALCQFSYQQLHPQTNVWNSNFKLTRTQIAAANLSKSTANNVEIALRFERTNNAYPKLTQHDPFYHLPSSYNPENPPPAGTVLKVEQYTNVSHYTTPMSLSMSRFLYTTETLNGTIMPASAYVLWPYLPRSFPDLTPCSSSADKREEEDPLFPVIAFAHGTSGQTQACAPSGLRGLWDDFHEPFPLALAGYAVVAPDYLGLGVEGTPNPYFVLPSQANDLGFAVEAARQAWPEALAREFVVAGQSQGGGVAWSFAQRQVEKPVSGYLGTMAGSPFTDVLGIVAADAEAQNNGRVVGIAQGLGSVLPGFEMGEWVTEAGMARWELLKEIQGCGLTGAQLFSAEGGEVKILKEGWNLTDSAKWYANVSNNGGKPFAGPMMVIQGMDDPNANEPVVSKSVRETCRLYPDSQLEYSTWENITHVPVLFAGQHMFLDWIHDRFAGKPAQKGCSEKTMKPSRGAKSSEFAGFTDATFFIEYDVYGI
ncbi:uncharacterized protein LTR77_006283 [Saxophila tyrrhenica]|uniref:AB hydrolase-1 domain-containing protein n=1 Tax=Saxophila tyrrhenica TaxID=1690608 RepID=A0AAV9P7H2_9PEZI|nr:hypothetical protein LTR77_006283 [Saxophila tyrrhenica]